MARQTYNLAPVSDGEHAAGGTSRISPTTLHRLQKASSGGRFRNGAGHIPISSTVATGKSSITMDDGITDEQSLALCRAAINRMYTMFLDEPRSWRSHVPIARTVIARLDSLNFMSQIDHVNQQAWFVNAIQRLAFQNADVEPIADLDTWTSRQWLSILQRDPRNVVALRGMGWAWLQRAQPALARIHRMDGSSSSSGGTNGIQALAAMVLHGDEERLAEQANAEAECRAGTTEYVEARGFLQPSTEYLSRAVAAATSQHIRSGELLATAAEAFMSLGNASSPRNNEIHFRRAIQLLRAASNIDDYELPSHLQHYLADFGRLVD